MFSPLREGEVHGLNIVRSNSLQEDAVVRVKCGGFSAFQPECPSPSHDNIEKTQQGVSEAERRQILGAWGHYTRAEDCVPSHSIEQ